jgi:hypothetical protein
MIWELIVWPLILENDRAFSAVEEYKGGEEKEKAQLKRFITLTQYRH